MAKFQHEKAYALRAGMANQPPAQGQPTGQITSGTTLGGVHPGMRPAPSAIANMPGAQQGILVGTSVQQMHTQMQSIPSQQQGQKPSSK